MLKVPFTVEKIQRFNTRAGDGTAIHIELQASNFSQGTFIGGEIALHSNKAEALEGLELGKVYLVDFIQV